ncbi:large ribosomal subunit protein bL34m isoform X2 [Cynoglossus semilaevis]|uniref:Large ribosomal subunit protein bL34m n=1 Tax=Cynoglossus semilaevis TaxID=244447 RepID=A0A3P8VVT9_CYNSE|nr:39S ribosomal protein L34, mitochondrial isoform X2 [Cynoglossus semilaevis]
MNSIFSSFSRLRVLTSVGSIHARSAGMPATSHLRLFSSWIASRTSPSPLISKCGPLSSQAEGSGLFQQLPCQYQQIRTRKRGIEYQPKNIKRKRTHGWIKRMRTKSGIEVVLRRMLKGRKSLTH